MIDLDYYCFRERTQDENGERLLIPRSNPGLYEEPIDYVFPSSVEAVAWLSEALDEEWVDEDEVADWVLVHYTGTVAGTVIQN